MNCKRFGIDLELYLNNVLSPIPIMQTLLQGRKVDHEREFLTNLEYEERYKREFLIIIQELLDEEAAQTKSQSQQLTANLSESQGKSRKEFEEYEKEFLNRLAVRSKERIEMRKKADEIVTKRLFESQIEI